VVEQVFSDARQVDPYGDAGGAQVTGRPDAGKKQQFRRVEGSTANDYFAPGLKRTAGGFNSGSLPDWARR
jgi:hypothetical protein